MAFVLLSATSAIFLVVSTINYLGFFPALSNISSTITSLVFVNASKGTSIVARVNIENPNDYSGFKIATITLTTYFTSSSSNNKLFSDAPLNGYQSYFTPLPARANMSLNATIPIDAQQSTQLSSFYAAYRGRVVGNCTLDLKISTFLDNALHYYDIQPFTPGVQLVLG